ncbi:hypothetical protein M9H77_34857 [Catharanthus roseus]|uniref:Uncharacterized protein n=1 Tax=Catharanthus roseus TaxID=4058 RepID=A0ACB9ZPI6_CATRO|nr:hypothetical protein M9H77_34857 [Catharanthus roseus]
MSIDGGYQKRPQVRGGRRGVLGRRRYYRPQEEYPRREPWYNDNFYEDYGDNPNVGQAYHGGYSGNQQGNKAFDKSKSVVTKSQASTYKSWPKKEDTPKVAFKDHSKPKVEEKGRLITNPTRCFKCNGVGHIVINCPTKRTLVFGEDLNGWIEKSNDDFQEGEDLRTNLFKGGVDDMNRTNQSPLDLKLGLITRAQRKKLKLQEDNGMNNYMEDVLKDKIEEFDSQGKLPICSQCVQLSRSNQGNNLGCKVV